MEDEKIYTCRHCKHELLTRAGRCPYCGTFNPTVHIKEIVTTMAFVLAVMYAYTYFVH